MIWVVAVLEVAFFATAAAALMNLARMRRLSTVAIPERERWPTISVVIPARNEALHLEEAMGARMATDYPGLEVILVDDRSDDDTGAIADRLAGGDDRITVVHNTELPDGWLGKVHALDLGAKRARGEWILFSDGDVRVGEGTLRRAVAHCENEGFDLLASVPAVDPAGPWVGALHAIFARLFFAAAWVGAIESNRTDWVIGVGAFTLVRRAALEASAGFAAFRLDVADDLMLAKVVKRAGGRCTLVNGVGTMSVDFYPTVRDFLSGIEKSSWSVAAQFRLLQGLVGSALLLAIDLSPFALVALAGAGGVRALGIVLVALALGISAFALVAGGRRPWVGLLYPIGSVLFAFGMARGTVLGWWRGGLDWRGTFYPTGVLRAAARAQAAAKVRARARRGSASASAAPEASPRSDR